MHSKKTNARDKNNSGTSELSQVNKVVQTQGETNQLDKESNGPATQLDKNYERSLEIHNDDVSRPRPESE